MKFTMTGADKMEFIVNKEWLVQQLENKLVKIVDCRFVMGEPDRGREMYRESHIPGAYYFDLEEQMSNAVEEHGGRHPLPDVEEFRKELEKVGINKETTIVAYDEGEGQYAARFWWLASYLGHDRVFVLDEGFHGWKEADYPTDNELPKKESTSFPVDIQEDMLVTHEDVKKIAESNDKLAVLIDSRSKERYLGKEEPIDKIAGRIPGSINFDWEENIREGSFKKLEVLKDRFSDIKKEEPIVVYCGSGVTATVNYLVLKWLGFSDVKLYAGSYSDWISYEENSIEKGD